MVRNVSPEKARGWISVMPLRRRVLRVIIRYELSGIVEATDAPHSEVVPLTPEKAKSGTTVMALFARSL